MFRFALEQDLYSSESRFMKIDEQFSQKLERNGATWTFFFSDPSEIPLPPDEVTIQILKADLWPDGKRLKVYLEVDPSQRRPSAELTVYSPTGARIANADIIESMTHKMELNMHLRGDLEPGEYTLEAILFFVDLPDPADKNLAPDSIERKVVDVKKQTFLLD